MADNITVGGIVYATKDNAGVHHQKLILQLLSGGAVVDLTQPLTDTQLRAVAVPVSGTVTANVSLAGSTNNIGDVDVLSLPALPTGANVIGAVTQSGTWNVGSITTLPALAAGTNNIGDVDVETFEPSADVTLQNAAVAVGNGTVLTVTGYGTAVVQVTGTFVATITFEGTVDGTNYQAISATQMGAAVVATTATAPGIYRMSPGGLTNIRARISAFTSGSITVVGRATNAPYAGQVVATELDPAIDTIDSAITGAHPVVDVRAVLFAVNGGGTYGNIQRTNGGNLKTSVQEFDPAASLPAGTATIGNVGIVSNGVVSTVNSTTANLAGGAVFTGTSEDVSGYSNIAVSVFASHASATDGLSVQQSIDGTNWDLLDVYTIPATTGKTFNFGVAAKFYRLVYTNGATLTTSLRIQTLYTTSVKRGSSIRPQDARTNDNDFEEVATYLNHFNGTSWDRARGTVANGLAVDVTRLSALVAGTAVIGSVNGRGGWTANHTPAAATRPTITKAAVVGQRNVCTAITVTLSSTAAPTAGNVQFVLRDGATGAGTILWAGSLSIPAVAGNSRDINLGGLWIEGTTNTALTLEAIAAPAAATFASVAMTGTNIV